MTNEKHVIEIKNATPECSCQGNESPLIRTSYEDSHNDAQHNNILMHNLWNMMTPWHMNALCITDTLCGEFTGHWRIHLRKEPAEFNVFFYISQNKLLN